VWPESGISPGSVRPPSGLRPIRPASGRALGCLGVPCGCPPAAMEPSGTFRDLPDAFRTFTRTRRDPLPEAAVSVPPVPVDIPRRPVQISGINRRGVGAMCAAMAPWCASTSPKSHHSPSPSPSPSPILLTELLTSHSFSPSSHGHSSNPSSFYDKPLTRHSPSPSKVHPADITRHRLRGRCDGDGERCRRRRRRLEGSQKEEEEGEEEVVVVEAEERERIVMKWCCVDDKD